MKGNILALFPILGEKASSPTIKRDGRYRSFVNVLYGVEEVPSVPSLLKGFYHAWGLGVVKSFLLILSYWHKFFFFLRLLMWWITYIDFQLISNCFVWLFLYIAGFYLLIFCWGFLHLCSWGSSMNWPLFFFCCNVFTWFWC